MSLVELEKVKAGVGATGFTNDDVELQRLSDMSEIAIGHFLRRNLTEEFPSGLPRDLEGAVISLVDTVYNGNLNDEGLDPNNWPFLLKFLLSNHRSFT